MLKETQRILKPGGHYFVVSMGQPKNRASHFVRKFLCWDHKEFILCNSSFGSEIEQHENGHYIYVCRKGPEANKVSKKYFPREYQDILAEIEEDEEEYKQSVEIEVESRKEPINAEE